MPLCRTPPVRRAALALLAAVSASAAAFQPQTKENTYAPPGWNPAADYNATLAEIPAEDKAYLELTRIDLALRAAGLPEDLSPRPGDDAWPALAAWLERDEVRALLADLRAAAARPHLGWPLSDGYPDDFIALHDAAGVPIERLVPSVNAVLVNARVPLYGTIRRHARLLAADTARAVAAGDSAATAGNILATLQLADLCAQPGLLIGQLVQQAVAALAQAMLLDTMHADAGFFNADQLARFATALDERTPVTVSAEFETLIVEDALRRMADPNGRWSDRSRERMDTVLEGAVRTEEVPPGVDPTPAAWPVDRVLRRRAALLDPLLAQFQRPWSAEAGPALRAYSAGIQTLEATGGIPGLALGMLDAGWDRVLRTAVRANTELSATRLAVAVYRHKLRHGAFPASLADLDADLLASPPIDFHTGEPLLYALRDGSPIIASAGNDRDDDGFRPALNPDGTPAAPAWIPLRDDGTVETADPDLIDGDWILFPPRGLTPLSDGPPARAPAPPRSPPARPSAPCRRAGTPATRRPGRRA
jgi:hypothetical protein